MATGVSSSVLATSSKARGGAVIGPWIVMLQESNWPTSLPTSSVTSNDQVPREDSPQLRFVVNTQLVKSASSVCGAASVLLVPLGDVSTIRRLPKFVCVAFTVTSTHSTLMSLFTV